MDLGWDQKEGTTESVLNLEQGCFLSVNVSVCLRVNVLSICFAFSSALENLRK